MSQVYLAALHSLPHITHAALRRMLRLARGNAERLWCGLAEILGILKVPDVLQQETLAAQTKAHLLRVETLLRKLEIRVLYEKEDDFPDMEKVSDPPCLLYARGNSECLRRTAIALVGARRMTPYGQAVVPVMVGPMVQGGLVTVSGLARGVDGTVHRETLRHRGQTVAVVGTGLDACYPYVHRSLAEDIITSGGLLLSEFPLGAPPNPWHFPRRNRLIARLAQAVVIVEAAESSGSLLTAQHAREYGLPVYVVPGSIFSRQSAGANALLGQERVFPLVRPEDLIGFCLTSTKPGKVLAVSRILESLSDLPQSVTAIAGAHTMPLTACLAELGRLEVLGLATSLPEGWIRKRSP